MRQCQEHILLRHSPAYSTNCMVWTHLHPIHHIETFFFIVLFCIVLMGWSLLSNALRPFWDLLCSPNLDTRTWICRLNFAQGPFFQAWGSLTSLKSQTRDPQLKVPPGRLLLMIFMFWRNPSTSTGFELANLGSRGEHFTPRPPSPTYLT